MNLMGLRERWLSDDRLLGRTLIEPLAPEEQARRAVAVLDLCKRRCRPVPAVDRVCELGRAPGRWTEGHVAFDDVRHLNLLAERVPTDAAYKALLDLAESTAKTIYNASGAPAPFDHHAPWRIPERALAFVRALGDDALLDPIWGELTGTAG
jgi:hypothetical protein